MSNVQISRELWEMLCDYFFDDDDFLYDDIRIMLSEKLEKIKNREMFSQYKSSSGSDREQFRSAYLDQRGIRPSFRTDVEWHDEPP